MTIKEVEIFTLLLHNNYARHLDAPLIQVAGTFFLITIRF